MLLSSFSKKKIEAGCDEAGRGCLAGPVVAAAVVFPSDYFNDELNDSKQLNEAARFRLRHIILRDALHTAISFVDEKKIDEINILNASILGMHQALEQLTIPLDFVIADGNKFKPFKQVPHETIVKGDAKYLSIAAASILAKTARDIFMEKIHEEFPQYNWQQNKGYPTVAHREAIRQYGACKYHRQSFQLLPLAAQGDLFA